jgi:hypothetical protein
MNIQPGQFCDIFMLILFQARQSNIRAAEVLNDATSVSAIFRILSTILTCQPEKETLPHRTVSTSSEEPLQHAICEHNGLQMKLL